MIKRKDVDEEDGEIRYDSISGFNCNYCKEFIETFYDDGEDYGQQAQLYDIQDWVEEMRREKTEKSLATHPELPPVETASPEALLSDPNKNKTVATLPARKDAK